MLAPCAQPSSSPALLEKLAEEARALRAGLLDGYRRDGASIDAASPRHVAIGLAARGCRLINDLAAHARGFDHEKIKGAMRARDELGADCLRTIDLQVQQLSSLIEAAEALSASKTVRLAARVPGRQRAASARYPARIAAIELLTSSLLANPAQPLPWLKALVECLVHNEDVSMALSQLRASAFSSEAKMHELGSVLLGLDELGRILQRVQCEEADLLRLAQLVLREASTLTSAASVSELCGLPVRLEPMATESLLSLSTAPSFEPDSRSSTDALLRSLKSVASGANLSASRSLVDQLGARGWRQAIDDTRGEAAASSPLRDAVSELRARYDLRPLGSSDGLHPLIEVACCRTTNACYLIGALSRLPVVASRTPDDYHLPIIGASFAAPLQADPGEGGARGAFLARIGGKRVFLKGFPFAAGRALAQEVTAREIVGAAACTTIEAAFVHNNAVWLESRATSREALAAAALESAQPLLCSWPHDVANWRALDAFRTLLCAVRSAHQAGLAFCSAILPEHLIIDSQRGALLLTALWRTQARADSAAFAADMRAFGQCLFIALLRVRAPDHPQQLEAQLAKLNDEPTRELLGALLSDEPPSAAECLLDPCFVGMMDRMRVRAAVVAMDHRKEVWAAHARCLGQLSQERGPLRIIATRANIVDDVLLKFSAMRSTEDLLKPLLVSFELHERIASDQGGVTRELFTHLFERLRADAASCKERRLLDMGSGTSREGCVFLPSADASPLQCEALGRVLLKMLLLGLPCPLRLAPSMVKALACSEEELSLRDLEAFDSQAAHSLRSVLRASGAELDGMGLAFSADEDPERANERVTTANVQEFVAAKIEHILEKSRALQVERIVFGFRAVPPLDAHLDLLGTGGLAELLFDSASRALDPHAILRSLVWQDWPAGSAVPARLSECIGGLDQERLGRFLRLATGSLVWPADGFDPPITVQRCPPSCALPVGSTCFHVVRVPDYAEPSELEAKVLMALDHVGEHDLGYV